jgi:hypothetical protein
MGHQTLQVPRSDKFFAWEVYENTVQQLSTTHTWRLGRSPTVSVCHHCFAPVCTVCAPPCVRVRNDASPSASTVVEYQVEVIRLAHVVSDTHLLRSSISSLIFDQRE